MHQAADLAVGGALDGFVGWANQVCAEQVDARDGAIGCAPFGQMVESNGLPTPVMMSTFPVLVNLLLVESTAAVKCQPVLTCFQVEEEDVTLVGGRCEQVVAVRRGRWVVDGWKMAWLMFNVVRTSKANFSHSPLFRKFI